MIRARAGLQHCLLARIFLYIYAKFSDLHVKKSMGDLRDIYMMYGGSPYVNVGAKGRGWSTFSTFTRRPRPTRPQTSLEPDPNPHAFAGRGVGPRSAEAVQSCHTHA